MAYTITELGGVITLASQGPGYYFNTPPLQPNGHIVSAQQQGVGVPTATTAAAGSNAGLIAVTGSDTAGRIVLPASANPVVGQLAQVFFGQSYAANPFITLTPATASAALNLFVAAASTNSFIFGAGTVPVASATMVVTWLAIG